VLSTALEKPKDRLIHTPGDLAATLYGLSKPARVTLEQAALELSPMQLSFMQESRRLNNSRLKRELRMKLRYPSPAEGLLGG
jgi:hypothetical protein